MGSRVGAGGPGADGASGGTATVSWQADTLTGRTAGVLAVASGRRGGDGGRTFAPSGLKVAALSPYGGAVAAISVGGDGGTFSATNAAGADIVTRSAPAFGIYARSVGGGGRGRHKRARRSPGRPDLGRRVRARPKSIPWVSDLNRNARTWARVKRLPEAWGPKGAGRFGGAGLSGQTVALQQHFGVEVFPQQKRQASLT